MREKELEKIKEYKYGFSTDIESIRAPKGLNKEVIKFISNIKKEPQWMLDWRLRAYERLQQLKEPDWQKPKFPKIDYQNLYYYSAPKSVKTVQCKKESKKGCNGRSNKCITHYLWDELEIYINDFFEKKNLGDLLKNNLETRI